MSEQTFINAHIEGWIIMTCLDGHDLRTPCFHLNTAYTFRKFPNHKNKQPKQRPYCDWPPCVQTLLRCSIWIMQITICFKTTTHTQSTLKYWWPHTQILSIYSTGMYRGSWIAVLLMIQEHDSKNKDEPHYCKWKCACLGLILSV